MVMVYAFEAYNLAEDRVVRPAYKMTRESIELWECVLIEGTGEEVLDDRLDHNGRYVPSEWSPAPRDTSAHCLPV